MLWSDLGWCTRGDKICCQSASYLTSLRRICWKCTVPGHECHNLEFKCKKMSMRKMKKFVENENTVKLQKCHQHCVKSMWCNLSYGGCEFGVFSAANPTEWLHALDNGLIECCLHVLCEDLLTVSQCTELDNIAKWLTKLPWQRLMSANLNSCFPRLLWKSSVYWTGQHSCWP